MVFSRLENVCYCIEQGEWPQLRRFSAYENLGGLPDSRSNTPVPPNLGRSNSEYFVGGPSEGSVSRKRHKHKVDAGIASSDESRDFKVSMAEV